MNRADILYQLKEEQVKLFEERYELFRQIRLLKDEGRYREAEALQKKILASNGRMQDLNTALEANGIDTKVVSF